MLTYLAPIDAGNAVQATLSPPTGAVYWRVLRSTADTISGPDDAAAVRVYQGNDSDFVDIDKLKNGTPYFYRAFSWDGSAWTAHPSRMATPAVGYRDVSPDVVTLLRERIDLGMQHYLGLGKIKHPNNRVPVMNATPPYEGTMFPVVSVIVESDGTDQQFVGGVVGGDVDNGDGTISSFYGHLSRYQIKISAFTPNSDTRATLRMALKAILTVNESILEANQVTEVQINFSDQDDFQNYDGPMFMVQGSFSCLAPSAIETKGGAISDVLSTATFV